MNISSLQIQSNTTYGYVMEMLNTRGVWKSTTTDTGEQSVA